MKTSKLVEPAEMNGSGKPVGGIEPVNTSYSTINLNTKKSILMLFFILTFIFENRYFPLIQQFSRCAYFED